MTDTTSESDIPRETCRACNFGRHICPGCGTSVDHGTIVCDECKVAYDEAAARYIGGEPDTPAQHAKDWADDWGFKPDESDEPEVDLSSAFTDEMGKTL